MKRAITISVLSLILIIVIAAVAEILYVKNTGQPVPAPNIPRDAQSLGSGASLTYVVIGDSTSIGQGAQYAHSYAMQSAEHLAQSHHVTFLNFGISGARAQDVVSSQLKQAVAAKPDVILLAVGANDARRFTSDNTVQTAVQKIITDLRTENCNVRIVSTGSPDMSSVPRFPWPIDRIMKYRTNKINNDFQKFYDNGQMVSAPIAKETGAAFAADPTLFAADKFHPNDRGYALWTPVVIKALDTALAQDKPRACDKP